MSAYFKGVVYMKEILLSVERDDFNFGTLLRAWEKQGFNLLRASNMNEAIKLARKTNLIAVIINADNINYLPQLAILRDCINILIYIMTSNFSSAECIESFKLGADVYTQWCNLETAALQMFVLYKRISQNNVKEINFRFIENGGIYIYPDYRKVFLNDNEINLRKKEFDILYYLVNNKGKVITFEQIYSQIWGEEYSIKEHHLLWNQVSNLRKKISDVSGGREYIECIKGVGYRFKVI